MSVNRKLAAIRAKLTALERHKIAVYQHPHHKTNYYFAHKVVIGRNLRLDDLERLNRETRSYYSEDGVNLEISVSFQDPRDAALFKLYWND